MERPPFDWTPFFPVDEPEVIAAPVPVAQEPVFVAPPVAQEPVFMAPPVMQEPATPREALVFALEQLAFGDREVLQRLPGLLELPRALPEAPSLSSKPICSSSLLIFCFISQQLQEPFT